MRKFMLAAGAAALAISVPALADRGGHGGGQSHFKGQSKAEHGGHSVRAVGDGSDKGRGHGRQFNVARIDREQDRGHLQVAKHENHSDRSELRDVRKGERQAARNVIQADRDIDRDDRVRVVARNFEDFNTRGGGLINGCPPGLDRKDNGCLPPGQARKLLGTRLQSAFASALVPQTYRSWYRDDDDHFYRAGDGFIYRVDRQNSLVDGIIPLFGGGNYYALGDSWPDPYNFYNVPYQYRSLYADTPNYAYRYGDGAIYRVNTGSGLVDGIVALLAGDLGVGSRLPMGYDVYNVPFAYRDRYYDTADNWYRYNDGYIYQVDPKTRLISAVIDALI